MARAALDGMDVTTLQNTNPTIGALMSLLSETKSDGKLRVDDRVAMALLSASVLGSAVFGPFVRAAAQLTNVDDEEVAARIEEVLARLLSET